jgi:alcohol dehydrogenase (cytochrome c)
MEPPADTWPMYNGDYREPFQHAQQINDVMSCAQSGWVYRASVGGGGFGGSIKATPLLMGGVLYFVARPWAIDARTGRKCGTAWESKGGTHWQPWAAAYGDWLYFETPDCNLVSLNLKDGKKRWQHRSATWINVFWLGYRS